MSVFFNGRLWTTPATMSVVDDSQMYNRNLSVGNILALIGTSSEGDPKTVYRFGSASEAKEVLGSGELLKAVEKAFDPSSQTYGPTTVIAIRTSPATKATLILKNGSAANVIELESAHSGRTANSTKIKIENATIAGRKKVTTQRGNSYYTKDNIGIDCFTCTYTGGEASARISVSGTDVVLEAPAGATVGTLDLNIFDTVQSLADGISTFPGFSAVVSAGASARKTMDGLDFISAQNCKTTGYVVKANLAAIIEWINSSSERYVTATRSAGAGTLPANIDWTYLSGGTDTPPIVNDWSDCFALLQAEDVQWVVPVSSNPSIHAMADTHCAFMSNIARMERRAIVGTALATTDDDAVTAAKNLNSDRTSLVHLGFYDYDDNGDLALFPPYILAAQLAGMFSGVNPGTALTNKSIKVRGLERKLRNPTDTDVLIDGGVLTVEETKKGYKVVKSITTWLVNDNYNRVEVSVGVALDFVSRNVRDILDDLRGEKGNPVSLAMAVQRVDSTLRELARPEPMGPAVIVGDKENPAYKNITASLEGDVMRVEFQVSPVIPINYIPCVIHAVPYSGSASA
jgi:hypothetical protein